MDETDKLIGEALCDPEPDAEVCSGEEIPNICRCALRTVAKAARRSALRDVRDALLDKCDGDGIMEDSFDPLTLFEKGGRFEIAGEEE